MFLLQEDDVEETCSSSAEPMDLVLYELLFICACCKKKATKFLPTTDVSMCKHLKFNEGRGKLIHFLNYVTFILNNRKRYKECLQDMPHIHHTICWQSSAASAVGNSNWRWIQAALFNPSQSLIDIQQQNHSAKTDNVGEAAKNTTMRPVSLFALGNFFVLRHFVCH